MNGDTDDAGWPKRKNRCLYCHRELTQLGYTVRISGKSVTLKRAQRGTRAMHRDCAKAWVEKSLVTPTSLEAVPEVGRVNAELIEFLKEYRMLCEKIEDRERLLSSMLWDHHRAMRAQLRGEEVRFANRSHICQDCGQTFVGNGYLLSASRDAFGFLKRFCLHCLELHGELGLYLRHGHGNYSNGPRNESDVLVRGTEKPVKPRPRLCIVVPFRRNGEDTNH